MTGHVQDMWMRTGPNGRKIKGPRHGVGKRWQARWQQDGKEKAKRFDSKETALAHIARIEVHGPVAPRPRITFGEYAETWRLSQLHHRTHTISALNTIFTKMLNPQLGRLPIIEVTRQDVQNAVIEWSSHYAPATVIQAYGYCKTVFADAIFNKVLTETPCVRIKMPEKVKKRLVPMTPDQVQQLTAAMPDHLQAAVTLAAATGLRIGEIGGLSSKHIVGGRVIVERQLIDTTHGMPVFGPPKTKSSVRDVTMGQVAADALTAHQKAHQPQHGLLFGTARGGPLDRRRASQVWRTVAQQPGLEWAQNYSWHDLRHWHASALIAAGLSPRAVAERLGHSNVSMTLNVYSALWGNDDSRSVDAIDEILSGQ